MLNVDNLSFRYGSAEVFSRVSFRVEDGQMCGLFGPNGSGKTTLFKCCLNFLDYPTGQVRIGGEDVKEKTINEMARLVAYVPQEHKPAFPYLVKEVVLMGRTPHMGGVFGIRKTDKAKALEALNLLGITHLAERPYNQLSGGQRQLVLIARALAQDTKVLFLDEPTASLDFKNQILIWQLLQRIAHQGTTVFVCTHDPNHVLWFCGQAVVMGNGGVIADGPPAEAINTDTLTRIYGEVCTVRTFNGFQMVAPATVSPAAKKDR